MLRKEEIDIFIKVFQEDRLFEVKQGIWTEDKQKIYCEILAALSGYRDLKAWGKSSEN